MATREQLDQLRLAPRAKTGAVLLNERFPDIQFTSGLRDTRAQARVMASNQLRKPFWIKNTYIHGRDLQQLIDAQGPQLLTQVALQEFIQNWLESRSVEDLAGFSRHLGGYAFDIKPIVDHKGDTTALGFDVLAFVHTVVLPEKFLQWEGGLQVWHLQFIPTEEV
jgi:hypothetical protein